MSPAARHPSIRRQLSRFVLGALCIGAPILALAAYALMLAELDEVMDDSLHQTALLLSDKDLRGAIAANAARGVPLLGDAESHLVAVARRPDGTLLFTSEPEHDLRFSATEGLSVQDSSDARWHVYTVVQPDRIVQVAQPSAVRRDMAIESATQLLVPLVAAVAVMALLLFGALRHGLKPLDAASAALARRGIDSLQPIELDGLPDEMLPLAGTLNDLLGRLDLAVRQQRQFVADAAHELRSPMTALRLQAQLVARIDDPAERARASADLEAGALRMSRLVEQLLALSRTTGEDASVLAAQQRTVDLAEHARAAVARWTPEAERRGLDLGAAADAGAVPVHADPVQIDMLLNNLVENALRYVPAGGRVDVIARRDEDGAAMLAVADDGPGIAIADQARVFDRFYRGAGAIADEPAGSGLGLAIVKAVAQRHAAHVALHPGLGGRGVEVRVTFGRMLTPAAAPDSAGHGFAA